MARKKKTTPTNADLDQVIVEAKEALKAAEDEFVPPTLTDSERLRLRCYEAEQTAARFEAVVKNIHKDAILKKVDPEGQVTSLQTEVNNLLAKMAASRGKYQEVIKEIEARLKIDMSQHSFDDETGTLIKTS